MKTDVTITAVWLRNIGPDVEVLVEVDGKFRLVITELKDGTFSHIAEGNNASNWPIDPLDGRGVMRPT